MHVMTRLSPALVAMAAIGIMLPLSGCETSSPAKPTAAAASSTVAQAHLQDPDVSLRFPAGWRVDTSAKDSRGNPITQLIATVAAGQLPPVAGVSKAPHWTQALSSTVQADQLGAQVSGSEHTIVSQGKVQVPGALEAYRTVSTYLNPASSTAPATMVRDVSIDFVTKRRTLVEVLLRGPDVGWDGSPLPGIETSIQALP
jgi:hypothetical protein